MTSHHIVMIVENLPLPFDRRVWQEAQALRDAGYRVSIIGPKSEAYPESYVCLDGIHLYRHPLPFEAEGALGYVLEYGTALFWEFLLSCKIALKHKVDAFHICNPPDLLFLVAAPFKLLGKKVLFDHHDINPELFEAKFNKRGLLYHLVVLFERLTFTLADVSIATNESYRTIAIERGKMNPDDVFVVRSGPKLERLKILPPVPSWKHGRRYMIGYVGVMGKQEGIEYLLQAMHLLVQRRDDIHLCLIGGGTSLEAMQQYASELCLDDVVTFTGRVPDQILLEVLNTADVCVNPDVANPMNDKSTMNKIMEYMALGKPIVQFDLTEGKVSAQQASLYAEANNATDLAAKIEVLLDDPALRQQMGDFGRNRVEKKLSWEYEVPKLLAAYDALFS